MYVDYQEEITPFRKKPYKNFLLLQWLGCENPNVTLLLSEKTIILPLFCFRYPFHSDFLVNGTDTKTLIAKKLRSNFLFNEKLSLIINFYRIWQGKLFYPFTLFTLPTRLLHKLTFYLFRRIDSFILRKISDAA